jgi:hypothetical protein
VPEEITPWVVKGVPERIRRKAKVFAAENNVTMARAVEFLIDTAFSDPKQVERRLDTAYLYAKLELPFNTTHETVLGLAGQVVDIEERKREGRPVTEEEAKLAEDWKFANLARISQMARYADEYEAYKREHPEELAE